jgi:hypothetical protein
LAAHDVDGGVAEVVSLSARQVRSLLRSLELHWGKLQVGHEASIRLALKGLRPAYLLDFDLIFAYVFQPEERPDWAIELGYLFEHDDTTFLIGPGTEYEIRQFMNVAGFMSRPDGPPEDLFPDRVDRQAYGLDHETIRAGLEKLIQMMEAPNVQWYSDIVANWDLDEDVFERAMSKLGTRRGDRVRPHINRADALNWTAVVHLRQNVDLPEWSLYPYLLTATRAILEVSSSSSEIADPVSRSPSEAIYTEVLLDVFDDPIKAANHTIKMAVEAGNLNRRLRQTPAFLSPQDFEDEPEWERVVEQHRVTRDLQGELEDLARFFSDPVIKETQRIYDNAQLLSINVEQQRGPAIRNVGESPRKLFDLIVEVSAALGAAREKSGLADLWKLVLALEADESDQRTTYELIERYGKGRKTPYLVADHCSLRDEEAVPVGEDVQFVLRWPSSLDSEAVIASFSRAFARHGVEEVGLVVGTDHAIEHFEVEIPFTLEEVVSAICEECDANGHALGPAQLRWVRVGADIFDLYADISPPDLARDPIIGVFVDDLNLVHLEELYARTSARYLLPVWFRRALEEIQAQAAA